LRTSFYFDIIGNMDTKDAVTALAALAQPTRLSIFRLLVETGPQGLPAGRIGELLGIAPATLSFHLKELAHADLVDARTEGRFIFYAANFTVMNGLVQFLTDNCCGGQPCCDVPVTSTAPAIAAPRKPARSPS
jgi:ArsR family transcriptional regulator, arsenate/arsenite/antimonite-responsive transcriptional repressor